MLASVTFPRGRSAPAIPENLDLAEMTEYVEYLAVTSETNVNYYSDESADRAERYTELETDFANSVDI